MQFKQFYLGCLAHASYYIGSGDKTPVVNGVSIVGPTRLDDGDLVEVSGVRLNFIVRD